MNGQEEVSRKPRIIKNPHLSYTLKQTSTFLYSYQIIGKCRKCFKDLKIYI